MTWPTNVLSIADATDEHYAEVLALLERARAQMRSIRAGEAQRECAVCGDGGHTVEECHRNPLLLSIVGRDALTGVVFKCFHCGAIYCDEQSAATHFGERPDRPAACHLFGSPKNEALSSSGLPHVRVGVWRMDGDVERTQRIDLTIREAIALSKSGSSKTADRARRFLRDTLQLAGML